MRIDATGLLCPLPVMRAQQAAKKLQSGDKLEIICTDANTLRDIPAWCRIYSHELILAEQRGKEYYFEIKVSKDKT
jgi:tRNA 2-thiouridine synthesizing protein A